MTRYKWGLFAFLLALALLPWALRTIWLTSFFAKTEQDVAKLANEIGPRLMSNQALDEGVYRNFVAQEPRVGYLVVANFRSNYRSGVTNPQSLRVGSKNLETFLREYGTAATLNELIQPQKGFAGEYLHVISAVFISEKGKPAERPIGTLKVGYVVPGSPSFGRGYTKILWVWFGACCIAIVVMMAWPVRRREYAEQPLPIDELAHLEKELERPEILPRDEEVARLKLLFDGQTLQGWRTAGNWYVGNEGELVGRPWGASIIRFDHPPAAQYVYQVQAKKIAGPDGFVVLFGCGGHSLSWVLGGWRNTRCEVAGYASTATIDRIEKNTWYQIEIRVTAEELEGYLSGELKWKLLRSDISSSSPDVGFLKGLGVAVWSTLAKFRDIRFSST